MGQNAVSRLARATTKFGPPHTGTTTRMGYVSRVAANMCGTGGRDTRLMERGAEFQSISSQSLARRRGEIRTSPVLWFIAAVAQRCTFFLLRLFSNFRPNGANQIGDKIRQSNALSPVIYRALEFRERRCYGRTHKPSDWKLGSSLRPRSRRALFVCRAPKTITRN